MFNTRQRSGERLLILVTAYQGRKVSQRGDIEDILLSMYIWVGGSVHTYFLSVSLSLLPVEIYTRPPSLKQQTRIMAPLPFCHVNQISGGARALPARHEHHLGAAGHGAGPLLLVLPRLHLRPRCALNMDDPNLFSRDDR